MRWKVFPVSLSDEALMNTNFRMPILPIIWTRIQSRCSKLHTDSGTRIGKKVTKLNQEPHCGDKAAPAQTWISP